MASAMKTCRVCGKAYEACHTVRKVAGVFRWQEVACSRECGSIYLAKVAASRMEIPVQPTVTAIYDMVDDDSDDDIEDEMDDCDDDEIDIVW